KIAAGRYYVTIEHDGWRALTAPSEGRIVADAVKLDSAPPTPAHPKSKDNFDFDIIRQNFSPPPTDNQLYVTGQGAITQHQFTERAQCEKSANQPCLWVESSERLRVLGYKSEPYQGLLSFVVRVGSTRSAEQQLVLSRISDAGVLVWTLAL